jgi:hypothetical protein
MLKPGRLIPVREVLMQNPKKRIRAILAFALLVTGLSGCSDKPDQAEIDAVAENLV